MDINHGSISLKDRIKALNLDKTLQLTPEKNAMFSTKHSSKYSEKSGNSGDGLSKETTVYSLRKLQKKTEDTTSEEKNSNLPSLNEYNGERDDDFSYSMVLNNTHTRIRSQFECSSEYSCYSDIPSNIPATFDEDLLKETMNAPTKRNSTFTQENADEIESEETGVYSLPINIPVDVANEKPPEPDEIKFKIENIRKTIKDRRMRKMVDMSDLLARSKSNLADNSSESQIFMNTQDYNGSVESPTFFKRSQSLGDAIAVENESIYKRPSLPVLNEQSNTSRFTYNTDLPLLRLSPESTSSRAPSVTSTHSTESCTSAKVSESEQSGDERRSRNFSDVSVTHEADNYISFKSLYDDVNNDFVVVKANTASKGELTLAIEPTTPSIASGPATSPTSPSTDESSPTGTPGKKTPKRKPRNVFGLISKTMKEKISSPKLSTSMRSPKSTESAGTSPIHQIQQFPKIASSPALASLAKHEPTKHKAQPAGKLLSPNRTTWYMNTSSTQERPKSVFTDSNLGDEAVYYDPSVDNGDSDVGDILTIEIIHEDDGEGIYNDGDLHQGSALTAEKRSQSLASLNHNFMERTEQSRRLSDNIGAWRQAASGFGTDGLYMTSSTPPIPPPKHKSTRSKNERKMTESDAIASPNLGTSSNGLGVKLRNKSTNVNDDERQNWPNRRPPSMPLDMPPSPPPMMSSKPSDSPSDKLVKDENEYVSATTQSGSTRSTKTDLVSKKAKPPAISLKNINFAAQANKNNPTTSESDEDDDTIYHTVADLDVKANGAIFNGVQNRTSPPVANGDHQKFSPQKEKRFPEKPPPLVPKKPISKPKPPEIPKVQKKSYNYTQVIPKTKGNTKQDIPSKPRISDSMDTNIKPNFPRVISAPEILQKPTLNKLQAKNNFNLKPELPTKPIGAKDKSKFDKINSSVVMQPSSLDVDSSDTVKPPPRPLRNKKLQEIAEKSVVKIDEQPVSPKVPQRSAAIAELGKLISIGGPLSPQHMKSSQLKTISKITDSTSTLQKTEQETTYNKAVTSVLKSNETIASSSLVTSSVTPKTTPPNVIISPSKAVTNIQNVLQAPSPQLSSKVPPPRKPRQKRPETKRPTIAPPPRPTGPPPPRPDRLSPVENNKISDRTVVAEKPGPPRRPPPPSSEKIKAAEERRKIQNNTVQDELDEDEYHDGLLKQEEDNTYADIDDDAFNFARAKERSTQKDTTPTPPVRAKHTMKRAINTMSAISAMKRNFGRRKSNDNILSEKPVVPSYGIYNDDEEAVYAGID